jgi:hypothetical protein
MISLMASVGLVLGLMLGYWPMRSSQNNMQEQLNRIEQYLILLNSPGTSFSSARYARPSSQGKSEVDNGEHVAD